MTDDEFLDDMAVLHAAGVVGNDPGIQPGSAGSTPARRSLSTGDGATLRAAPITLADANRFVETFHRHNGSLPSARFAVAAIDGAGEVHGVAIAGRPKARMLDSSGTLEVNRVCTDGTRNACSFLYGRCIRVAKALGYSRLITYTQASEDGASLKASGWVYDGVAGGGSWVRENPRWKMKYGTPESQAARGTDAKQRWQIVLTDPVPPITWPDGVAPAEHPALFEWGKPASELG